VSPFPRHLPKVEAEMAKIVAADFKFSREEVAPAKAKDLLHAESQRFKDEIIDELVGKRRNLRQHLSPRRFHRLCMGRTCRARALKAFKLLSNGGAYWRGDSNRQQLTAFTARPTSTRRPGSPSQSD